MSARKSTLTVLYRLPVPTKHGEFIAGYSEAGLCELQFPPGQPGEPGQVPAQVRSWHALTTRCVKELLAGREPKEKPPLDLRRGTEFQQRVWQELLRIGPGQTRTYGEVANLVKRKLAVRAVGGACGANPIPLLVPCHRVLAASGRLGGFTAGLEWKKLLLGIEGVSY